MKIVFSRLETKHEKNIAKTKVVCFGKDITGTKATTPKTCPRFESQGR
jgi:hypothetical protein